MQNGIQKVVKDFSHQETYL